MVAGVVDQPARVTPRPAATGMGVAEDSISMLPLVGFILAAGSVTGAGAYLVRRRGSER